MRMCPFLKVLAFCVEVASNGHQEKSPILGVLLFIEKPIEECPKSMPPAMHIPLVYLNHFDYDSSLTFGWKCFLGTMAKSSWLILP